MGENTFTANDFSIYPRSVGGIRVLYEPIVFVLRRALLLLFRNNDRRRCDINVVDCTVRVV